MSHWHFEQFRKNLAVRNADAISTSYRSITTRLNKDYWDLDSDSQHCLQVGSYGRRTAIDGISDLDMVFQLPEKNRARFQNLDGNGPSQLLQEVRACLRQRYPNTDIKGDGQVVVVQFAGYRVEVLPAFYNVDGSYTYGDTHDGGSWYRCHPRAEIAASNERHVASGNNLKHVCKMLRSWKEQQGAAMSGILIDTLVFHFFGQDASYNDSSYESYDELFRDVFTYLGNLPQQDYWKAPGSGQPVRSSGTFQRKAKHAAARCQDALEADTERKKEKLWRDLFGGRFFPKRPSKGRDVRESATARVTEEFIEHRFPLDIQYNLEIDSDVTEKGKNAQRLTWLRKTFPWLQLHRDLRFFMVSCDVPLPYSLYWKVRNVGPVAERRNMIRGQITADAGRYEKRETTDFAGSHYVECYAIKDGYCVAKDRIDVPIGEH